MRQQDVLIRYRKGTRMFLLPQSINVFTADCGLTTLHRENKEFSSKVRALAALAFLPFYQIPEIL